MPASFKTRLFEGIRRLYANPFGEYWLLKFASRCNPSDFAAKFIPMPHLFPKPSWRLVERHNVKLKLDISDFVDWYAYFELKDTALSFILSQIKRDDVVFDIGTNIGYVALRCAKVATHGKVFGFEPSSYNFGKCIANIDLNETKNLKVLNLALGDVDGFLNLQTISTYNRGMNRISTDGAENSERILINTLDQIVAELNVTKVDFLKIDVEGYEMHVLLGAAKTISTFRPKIFLEVNEGFLSNFKSSSAMLFRWLKDNQYTIFGMDKMEITAPAEIENKHTDILAIPIEQGSLQKNITSSPSR